MAAFSQPEDGGHSGSVGRVNDEGPDVLDLPSLKEQQKAPYPYPWRT